MAPATSPAVLSAPQNYEPDSKEVTVQTGESG